MIKSIMKAVKRANMVVDEAKIQEIVDRIGEEEANKNSTHGMPHWKVLRELRMEEIDKVVGEAEVVSKYLLWGPSAHGTISPATTGGVFYVRVVLTRTKIYTFAYDQQFRNVAKHIENLQDIVKVKQAQAGRFGIIPYDSLVIKFRNRDSVIMISKGEFSRKDFASLLNDLKDLGVDAVEKNLFE